MLDTFVLNGVILIVRAVKIVKMKTKRKSTQDKITKNNEKEQLLSFELKDTVVFFQYVGIFSTFFLLNFAFFFSYLVNTGQIRFDVVSKEAFHKPKPVAVKENREHHYLSYVNVGKPMALSDEEVKPSKPLAALVEYRAKEDAKASTKVDLGAKKAFAAANQTSPLACSFKQGNKLYSNQSRVVLKKADLNNHLCVMVSNVQTASFLWNVDGNSSQGNCVDLSAYNLQGSTDAFVYVENLNEVSACRLLIEGVR
jgi:hypothetical protein